MSVAEAHQSQSQPQSQAEREPERPTDEEILLFEKQVKAKEMQMRLVSDIVGFGALEAEYEHGEPIYIHKIEHLKRTCSGIRNVRKDGNCFYRAFGMRLAELMFHGRGQPWHARLLERALATKELMHATGYDMSILEDFYEKFDEVLKITGDNDYRVQESFEIDYVSDTVVCYLRLVTAALLKRDKDIYEAFVLDAFPTLESFIAECVEPMNVESDQIHIVAMAHIFGLEIRVANLDTTATDSGINYHNITPFDPILGDNVPTISLLYRPGHYDILYPN